MSQLVQPQQFVTTKMKKVLYGVSSVGLGHARRSLVIATKVKQLNPGKVQIDWVCAEPALSFMKSRGENVLKVSYDLESMSSFMEKGAKHGKIQDMSKVARMSSEAGARNYGLLKPIFESYDVLIQDEFIETMFAFTWDEAPPLPKKTITVTDYVRFETPSHNPFNRLVIGRANKLLRQAFGNQGLLIFADEPEALPASKSLKQWVADSFHIVGPVVEELPKEAKHDLKMKLSGVADPVKLVVFSVGGTSVGKELVKCVMDNADRLSESLNAYLVVLLGPRIDSSKLPESTSNRLSLVPFTPDAPRYFKAADCVVTQAGASTLNEVASLGVPCVCMPIRNHWEQRQNAMRFAEKYGFVVLGYDELSKVTLKRAIKDAMSKEFEPMKAYNAAFTAAKLISDYIQQA